jgi:subtilisin-like proprotein convertase family protein
MLEANSNLTWRDVQHILITTAEKNDAADTDWTTNGAGYHINHKYGFGRIDAQAAVTKAASWPPVEGETSIEAGSTPNLPIPDIDSIGVTDEISISEDIDIEFVEVYFSAADHKYWGDLEITLISPEGTESVLAEKHFFAGYNAVYNNWRFGSVRHFGESSQGDWTLKVKDLLAPDTGTFQSWTLKIYGTFTSIAREEVEDFVTRFYVLCLGRSPDPVGLMGWVYALLDGSQTGSDVAYGFVFSTEFLNKNTTHEEFLWVLYEAFLDRPPDAAGFKTWLNALNSGADRKDVLNGFIFATEFEKLCDQYDIKAHPSHHRKSRREAVGAFVTRFYLLCLDRNPDPAGLDGWTNDLLNQVVTGADVARGFIYSPEFIARNINNEDYLTILYQAFFDRDPDPGGRDVWMAELNSGKDRGDVLDGFLGSLEFSKLCKSFGITPY